MKYLKVFETDTDQQNYINGEFDRPNITIVRYKKQTINYVPNIIDDEENDGYKIIVFTVFGTEYQAEEGMTWEEFANSEYSNGEFVCEDWEVSCNNRSVCKQYGAVYVMPSDIIMENYNYVQYSAGGSN